MKSFKQLAFLFLVLAAFKLSSQAPAIQTEYVAPEEQQEDPKRSYIVGAGAFVVILAGVMLRRRLKKKRNPPLGK